MPGPGNYENRGTFSTKGGKIGTSRRGELSTVSPGPGAYDETYYKVN